MREIRIRSRILFGFFVGACLGVVCTSLLAGLASKKPHHLPHVEGPLGITEHLANVYLPEEKEALTTLLHAELGPMEDDTDLEKVKKILMHHASIAKIEFHQFDLMKEKYRAYQIYHDMRFGSVGYICNGHADLFIGELEVYGICGRRILAESISPSHPAYPQWKHTYTSHSTVEVMIDGRWILADPTFFALPKYQGDYIGLREALAIVCKDPSAQFTFESVSDRFPVERCYKGRSTTEYFRDMMFAKVLVYKPFHKYPYDDALRCKIRTELGVQDIDYTLGCGIVLESLTPAEVPASALYRTPTTNAAPPAKLVLTTHVP